MTLGNQENIPVGPIAFDNWHAFLEGKPLLGKYECLLYTDAWIVAEATTGLEPYQFFNLIPIRKVYEEQGFVCASIALRVARYIDFAAPNVTKTEASRYHGGGLTDEIAALASLLFGARLRPGGQTRIFEVNGDPEGKPVAWDTQEEPVLTKRNPDFILPRVIGRRSLDDLAKLATFPKLEPQKAITLIRCARLYQDALWLAESQPNLSWLLLVSAVETAATYWRTSNDSALDRLKISLPQLVELLEKTGIPDLCSNVAEILSNILGSTKKFIDFLLHYLPPPPDKRPAEWGQVKWDVKNLKVGFQQIYGYRSKALHDARPFPAPMCYPPKKLSEDWQAVEERPFFHAASVEGATWFAKDIPMSLHTFEYIARNALINWWLDSGSAPA